MSRTFFGLKPGRGDPEHARRPRFCQSIKGMCVADAQRKRADDELQTARLLVGKWFGVWEFKKTRDLERTGQAVVGWLGRSAFAGELLRAAALIPGNYLPCLSFDRRLRSEWHPPVFEADLDCLLSILEIRQAANFEPVQHKVI